MQTQEVAIKPKLKIVLKSDTEVLDEVIVTAYGTSTKGTFTGSASVMKADKIEKRQVSNVSNALAGAVAGVQILSDNGQPGESAKVRIRGVGSINAGMEISSLSPSSREKPSAIKLTTIRKVLQSTPLSSQTSFTVLSPNPNERPKRLITCNKE